MPTVNPLLRNLVLVAAALLLTAARLAAQEDPSGQWKAGVASAAITPKQSMWMAGYAARDKPSEGTAQDLYAKALAFEDAQGTRMVIVTSDLIGILRSVRDVVEKRVGESFNLPPEGLLLNASHTHCGPEYRGRSGREEEARAYTSFLEPDGPLGSTEMDRQMIEPLGMTRSEGLGETRLGCSARCGSDPYFSSLIRRSLYWMVIGGP
ncbi:MAG: neutral/alkaline non-lysosomal ceramidase N-terminal domain-containing protein [Planctomycetes bacterium]|nr:neutral/alkaline non-lysosomal ceramidase N-terminal domain-containing protein [Planctomycetota bacterium]